MFVLKFIAIIFFDIIDKFIHQKRIINFLKKINIKISTLIDVGSHKGLYTDLFLRNFNIKMVYMFEPQKKFYKLIKKKYKNRNKIQIFNNAISDRNTEKKIYINKHDLTSSLTKSNKNNFYLNMKAKLFGGNLDNMITASYNVKTVRLSDIIKKKKIKSIDLIKIDTEGHELNVIKGLAKEISKIKVILIEFHTNDIYINYNSNKIHKYLIKKDFVLKKTIKFPFTKWEDRIYLKNTRRL